MTPSRCWMSEYEALVARLASADETITTLDAENAQLHAANRDLNDEVTGLRIALANAERARDEARDLAVRCGAFHTSVGADYHAHLDGTWEMPLVDPGGELFK